MVIEINNGNIDETGEIILTLSEEEARLIHNALSVAVSSQKTKRITKLSKLFKSLDEIPIW